MRERYVLKIPEKRRVNILPILLVIYAEIFPTFNLFSATETFIPSGFFNEHE